MKPIDMPSEMFVYHGNTSWEYFSREADQLPEGRVRPGPALDPHTERYDPHLQGILVGKYVLHDSKASDVSGGKGTTLADAIEQAQEFVERSRVID